MPVGFYRKQSYLPYLYLNANTAFAGHAPFGADRVYKVQPPAVFGVDVRTAGCFGRNEFLGGNDDDYAPKTLTKQEVRTKTKSSVRELPIPDVVFEAILKERKQYEANRRRRSTTFQDLDYICCSTYGRPRSKNYHWQHYKKLLADNGLPDIRWHDLRSTYCTLLLKNNYSPKAVSKLMGHAKEIITMDVYGDNRNLIAMSIPELEAFVDEVIPAEKIVRFREDLLDIEIDVSEYLPAL